MSLSSSRMSACPSPRSATTSTPRVAGLVETRRVGRETVRRCGRGLQRGRGALTRAIWGSPVDHLQRFPYSGQASSSRSPSPWAGPAWPPTPLTLIGFAITMVGAVLSPSRLWLVGGIVVFLGGVFDMFDGTLAQATGKVSPPRRVPGQRLRPGRRGTVAYLGLLVGLQAAGVEVSPVLDGRSAMGGAVMVSYARAKSEGLGFTRGTGMAAVGRPREVRLVILPSACGASSSPALLPGASQRLTIMSWSSTWPSRSSRWEPS